MPVSGRTVQEVRVTRVRWRGKQGLPGALLGVQRLKVDPCSLSLSLPFPPLGFSSLKMCCLLGKDSVLSGTNKSGDSLYLLRMSQQLQ